MGELLKIDHISYTYHSLEGETPALFDVSFNVMDGEFLAIVGPSGCGNAMVELWKYICTFSPSHTTLSKTVLRYSLFSRTDNISKDFANELICSPTISM